MKAPLSNSIPTDLRDTKTIGVAGRGERSGWVHRGSVLIDNTWTAYIPGGPKSMTYPALQKRPEQTHKGRQPADGRARDVLRLPLFLTIKWIPEDLIIPKEIIVRVVESDFRFRINWKPSNAHFPTLASDPDRYLPVTKIIPFDPEWDISKGP